ncbi:hypothetical protein KAJ27_22075 [bacterium]|nr:hypothetical protein [bacterium]
MRVCNKLVGAVAAIPLVFIFVTPAFAYLDPGTGSAILQGVLGAVAAIAVVIKIYWHRILKMLGLRKDVKNDLQKK